MLNRNQITGEINRLRKVASDATAQADALQIYLDGPTGVPVQRKAAKSQEKASGAAKTGKKRIRRSLEQLQTEAMKMIAFAGKEGKLGSEINKKFYPDGTPGNFSVNAFLKKYAKGKYRSSGSASKTKYFAV